MRSRILSLFIVGVTLIAVTPAAHAAAGPGEVTASDVAASGPILSVLSSFTLETDGGAIVGGTRTVTVHNLGDEEAGTAIDLGPVPCNCVVASVIAFDGVVAGSSWVVGDLPAGAVASLSITYVAVAAQPTGVRADLTEPFAVIELSAAPMVDTVGVGVSRHIAV